MKRTDIRAGVVYAVKSSYGPPSPIVFLEDGAAGLYARDAYGRGGINKLEESKTTKARRGGRFSDPTRGYAAVAKNGGAGAPAAEVAAIRARAVSIRDGLAEAGIGASIVSTDSGGSISLRLDEAEKLIALLRDREG